MRIIEKTERQTSNDIMSELFILKKKDSDQIHNFSVKHLNFIFWNKIPISDFTFKIQKKNEFVKKCSLTYSTFEFQLFSRRFKITGSAGSLKNTQKC